jgi:cbb3-type cytochrome oxidase subunit 3
MEVLAITIFLSLLLSIFFVVLFLGQRRKRGGIEHESLLPLDDGPSPTTTPISVTVD